MRRIGDQIERTEVLGEDELPRVIHWAGKAVRIRLPGDFWPNVNTYASSPGAKKVISSVRSVMVPGSRIS